MDADILAPHPAQRGEDAARHHHVVASPVDLDSSASNGSFGGDEARHASKAPPAGKRDLSSRPEEHRARRSQGHGASTDGSPGGRSPYSPGKGHAHDPLEDFLFLAVGPGDDRRRQSTTDSAPAGANDGDGHALPQADGAADEPTFFASPTAAPDAWGPQSPVVSESPAAADEDFFTAAYNAEARRIRAQTEDAFVFLTRRVDKESSRDGARHGEIHGDGQGSGGGGGAGAKSRSTEPRPARSAFAALVKGMNKGSKGEADDESAEQR